MIQTSCCCCRLLVVGCVSFGGGHAPARQNDAIEHGHQMALVFHAAAELVGRESQFAPVRIEARRTDNFAQDAHFQRIRIRGIVKRQMPRVDFQYHGVFGGVHVRGHQGATERGGGKAQNVLGNAAG